MSESHMYMDPATASQLRDFLADNVHVIETAAQVAESRDAPETARALTGIAKHARVLLAQIKEEHDIEMSARAAGGAA